MRFHVEVTTTTGRGVHLIKREPAETWEECTSLAQSMASQMFPEDPMSSRTFRNGRFVYNQVNDLGDPVSIRPMIHVRESNMKVVEPSFDPGMAGFSMVGHTEDPHEPA